MADTEFDELDKAVASLGGPVPLYEVPAPQPPSLEVPVKVVAPAVVPDVPAAPVVAPRTRSNGRFMDMVPSRPSPTPPVEPSVAPVEPTVELPKPTFEQPDPLDFQGFKMDETPTVVIPTATPEPEAVSVEPLNTPFLNDAKVEKRPLGAFSDAPKPVESTPELPVELPKEEPSEAPLSAELHPDLLSIESAESEPKDIPPTPSIVQQYQEKPNSDTQPSAAIYDNEAYHMPLTHAAKKPNNWLVVIWIVALLIVGSGIGVMLYFVVLPALG